MIEKYTIWLRNPTQGWVCYTDTPVAYEFEPVKHRFLWWKWTRLQLVDPKASEETALRFARKIARGWASAQNLRARIFKCWTTRNKAGGKTRHEVWVEDVC
jgi:hypothetical protein